MAIDITFKPFQGLIQILNMLKSFDERAFVSKFFSLLFFLAISCPFAQCFA
jgi:hypothetical protein